MDIGGLLEGEVLGGEGEAGGLDLGLHFLDFLWEIKFLYSELHHI